MHNRESVPVKRIHHQTVRMLHLLKKIVRLGCIAEGFLRGSHQPKVLIHQTLRKLTAAFISGSGLKSVCVCVLYVLK